MRVLFVSLLLAACSVPPVEDKEPAAAIEQPAPTGPRKEENRHHKPKPSPTATVQAPPPPPLPTVEHCAKLEAENPKATVRAKLDCLTNAAKK